MDQKLQIAVVDYNKCITRFYFECFNIGDHFSNNGMLFTEITESCGNLFIVRFQVTDDKDHPLIFVDQQSIHFQNPIYVALKILTDIRIKIAVLFSPLVEDENLV